MRRDVGPAGSAEKLIAENATQNAANPVRRLIRNFFMLICIVNAY